MMIDHGETSNALHTEHLRQAYGFEAEFSSTKIVYPVGVEDIDYNGWSTFHYTAAANDISVLSDIINQEGFQHMESRTAFVDGHEFTPLLCACKGNAVDTFDILVSNGADVMAKDRNGLGVVEVAVLFRSIDLFQHLLDHGYEFNNLDIWQALLSMLYMRDDEEGVEMRVAAMEMTEVMMHKKRSYVASFIDCGGLNSIKDILLECINSPTSKGGSRLSTILNDEVIQEKNSLYVRTMKTFYGILQNISEAQGNILSVNYNEILTLLLKILNKGSHDLHASTTTLEGSSVTLGDNAITFEEAKLAGECLEIIACSKSWGLKSLIKINAVSNLLRSVLFDTLTSQPFRIIETGYRSNKATFLDNISISEIEVILSILQTEKRVDIKKFFIQLLIDLFEQGKSKHHMYREDVIETLLSGLDSPDTEYNRLTLTLLLSISKEDVGLQSIFKSTNSFTYMVNRVLLETEDRFDMCCQLLWMLIQSFGDLQDSVKVVENIGITTVVQMLDSLDKEIQCIGCECVKILLNSDKFDYHPQLIRKDVHTKMISLLNNSTAGHVLYSVMTSLSEMAICWSSFHPVPTVQNSILQLDCLQRVVQIAQSSRFTSAGLQSAAFLLIASTLLGNAMTEKRLSEEDIDIESELKKQTRHDPQSLRNAIKATSIFRYHALIMDNSHYKFQSDFESDDNISLFNSVVGSLCYGSVSTTAVTQLLEANNENDLICISTLSKLKDCSNIIVEKGLDTLLNSVYTASPRIKESAATALAALSYYKVGIEQLLIEHHEDPVLVETITQLSPNIPLSETFLSRRDANTVRDHRRRQLKKTTSNSAGLKLPDIGTNTIYTDKTSPMRSLRTPAREGKKTPVPGDTILSKMDTVHYREITKLGLTRPYSKVKRLPPLLLARSETQVSTHDRSLYTTVDRVYRKLYLRPATEGGKRPRESRPQTNQHGLAQNLSTVF